ncbi:hypothetical protein [Streptomyces sp. CT34]|uniref:hypothetical protein n=1 Tax=Streptomyces sp. CT34 TaxID=1553907 RepID=UPI00068FD44E|nr:hypothetical protein [Streptomyces sp. CT34]
MQQHLLDPVSVRASAVVRPALAVASASPISAFAVCRSPIFAAVYAAVASSELPAASRVGSGVLLAACTSCAARTAMSVARAR